MNIRWVIVFSLVYLFFLVNTINMPPNKSDDILYGSDCITGSESDTSVLLKRNTPYAYIYNAVVLQFQESKLIHGRFVTHILMRIVLTLPGIFASMIHALIICFIIFSCINLSSPYFYKVWDIKYFFQTTLFIVLALCTMFSFYVSFTYSYAYLYSSYLSIGLIALFFSPYFAVIQGIEISKIPTLFIVFTGLIAGNSHELSAAGFPMFGIIYTLLHYKKTPVPKWFYVGIVAYFVGFFFLIPTAGQIRIFTYGNTQNWQFMSQNLNWLKLGWYRYLYSLIRHLFITVDPWFEGPAWIVSTWYLHLIFCVFWVLNFKKIKDFWNTAILIPMLLFIFVWGTVISLMFSPMAHWNTIDMCRLFLFVPITSVITHSFFLYSWNVKKYIYLFIAIPVILGCMIIPEIYKTSQNYLRWVANLQQSIVTNNTSRFIVKIFGVSLYEFDKNIEQIIKKQNKM